MISNLGCVAINRHGGQGPAKSPVGTIAVLSVNRLFLRLGNAGVFSRKAHSQDWLCPKIRSRRPSLRVHGFALVHHQKNLHG